MSTSHVVGSLPKAALALLGLVALVAGLLGGVPPSALAVPTGNVVVDPTFAPVGGAGGRVQASAVQPDGKTVIGGYFQMVGGQHHANVARLNPDGSVDGGFTANVNGPVRAIAVHTDGTVVIGGSFTEVNGTQRGGIARLLASGALDPSFDSGAGVTTDPSMAVNALVVQPDGAVVIGGRFETVKGVPRGNIARLTNTGAVDSGFAASGGFNGVVEAILRQPDGAMVLGGGFASYAGADRRGIARLLPSGALDNSFNPGSGIGTMSSGAGLMPGTVYALVRQNDGRIIAGGRFNRVDGFEMSGVTRLNSNGVRDAGFAIGSGFAYEGLTSITALVRALHLGADGSVLAGGDFTVVNGVPRARLTRLTATGAVDAAFNPGTGIIGAPFNVGVDTLAGQADGTVVVGGLFAVYNGASHNAIFRVAGNGSAVAGYDPGVATGTGFNDSVAAVAVQPDGKIIAAGWFTAFNGVQRTGIARLNANGTLDAGFNPNVTAFASYVNALALQPDGKVIIGGGFTSVNGVARNQIARLNADGTLDASFNPGTGFNGPQRGVTSVLVQPDGKIVVGGDFTTFNGTPASRIARLNPNGSLDATFPTTVGFLGPKGTAVYALALQPDGKIVAAGDFDAYGGWWPTPDVVRINPDGSRDPAVMGSPGGPFFAAAIGPDGSFVVGGASLRRFLAAGQPDGSFAAPVFAGIQGSAAYIRTVSVLSDSSILVGGDFVTVGGAARSGIGRLMASGAVDPNFDPGSGFTLRVMSGIPGVASMVPLADGRIVVGGGFEGFNDAFTPPANITRLLPTVAAPDAPTGLSVTNGDGAALVSFTAPSNHGGAPITNYEYSVDGGAWTARVPVSAVPAVTVPGLANGVVRQVRVRAVNAAGAGAASAAVAVRPVAAVGSVLVPTSPARMVDTRVSSGGPGPIPAGGSRELSVAWTLMGGAPVVPAGAVALAYNLTVPSPGGAGHVRVMPGDATGVTSASAVNFRAGETIANAATVKISADRTVKVYNGAGVPVDVIIDMAGYFMPTAPAGAAVAPKIGASGLFTTVTPVRVYDTAFDPKGLLPAGGSRVVSPRTAADGVTPVVPTGASAVAYNITVVDTAGAGHLRVIPGAGTMTDASALNWSKSGERIANASVVGLNDGGRFTVFNGSGAPVRFFVDVTGYYSASGSEFFAVDPVRTTETRYVFGGAGPVAPVAAGVRTASTAASAAGGLPVVPVGATSVAFNATVTGTGGVGHLRVFPADSPLVSASLLNWPQAGYTRANASMVGVSPAREVKLYNGSGAPTDVLIDINGYYK